MGLQVFSSRRKNMSNVPSWERPEFSHERNLNQATNYDIDNWIFLAFWCVVTPYTSLYWDLSNWLLFILMSSSFSISLLFTTLSLTHSLFSSHVYLSFSLSQKNSHTYYCDPILELVEINNGTKILELINKNHWF